MKNILLIDDRARRQKELLTNSNVDISSFLEILDNKIDNEYEKFLEEIMNDTFILSNYEVIIVHQSIFQIDENKVWLKKFKEHCKKNNCSLVFFSGGNNNSYSNDEYEELSLSSVDLYSENLILFLEEFKNNNKNVLILNYGKRWKLNILLNILEKLSYFIDKNNKERVLSNVFERDNKILFDNLDNLNISFDENFLNNKIDLKDIINFKNNIVEIIKEMTNE